MQWSHCFFISLFLSLFLCLSFSPCLSVSVSLSLSRSLSLHQAPIPLLSTWAASTTVTVLPSWTGRGETCSAARNLLRQQVTKTHAHRGRHISRANNEAARWTVSTIKTRREALSRLQGASEICLDPVMMTRMQTRSQTWEQRQHSYELRHMSPNVPSPSLTLGFTCERDPCLRPSWQTQRCQSCVCVSR